MSKASFEIVKNDDRLYFNDGEKYVLLDTGFFGNPSGKHSVSVNGRIGPFAVNRGDQSFFDRFINVKMADDQGAAAVFNPMDGYACQLKGGTLTISDEETELCGYDYFFEFTDKHFPFIAGSINGKNGRFLFDSGARMTMFFDKALPAEPSVRTYREWIGQEEKYEDLAVYRQLRLEFPNGFEYTGEGALITDPKYVFQAAMAGIRAVLGIDIYNYYDMSIIANGAKRGIALHGK